MASEVAKWLEGLELPADYAGKFESAGFDKLSHLLEAKFTHSLLKEEVGITILAHRMRILAAIEQHEQQAGSGSIRTGGPSAGVTPPQPGAAPQANAEEGFAAITKLCNHVTFSCEQLLTEGMGNPTLMLSGAQRVGQGCSPLVQAAKAVAGTLASTDVVAHQRVIDAVGEIASSTQRLVSAAQKALAGAPDVRRAVVDITSACSSLLWAAQHKPSAVQAPLKQHSQSIINHAKAVNDACMCLMSGAKTSAASSDPDSCERVVSAAKGTALASQEMMTAAKEACHFILKGQVDPVAQENLLVAAKAVGTATAQLVRNAQAASMATGVDNPSHTQLLTFAAKSVADAVNNLVTASTAASESVPSLARREARSALKECKDAIATLTHHLNASGTAFTAIIVATRTVDITVFNVATAARSSFEREVDAIRRQRSLEIVNALSEASGTACTAARAVVMESSDATKSDMLKTRAKTAIQALLQSLSTLVERQLQDDLFDSASEFLASAKDLIGTARSTAVATSVPIEAQVQFIQDVRPSIEGARLLETALYAAESPSYRETLAVAANRVQPIATALLQAARLLLSKGATTQSNPTAAQSLITSITFAATATTKLQSAASATA